MKFKHAFTLILIFIIISCSTSNEYAIKETSRIKVIDHLYFTSGHPSFYIIEVDGHEYLNTYDGGIVHLESCKCKNK
jgi:hypothetical protein